MKEHYISTSRIGAAIAWGATAALVGAAWAAWLLFDSPTLAALLCMTGGSLSAAAAVLTIRCYSIRLGRLIRVTAGLGEGEDPRGFRVIQ